MPLKISEITDIPGLEAFQLCTGEVGRNNNVRWPYVAENREVGPWLSGGELIFVTGINLQYSITDYQRLIEEALEYHAAGLVILTGPEFIHVIPEAVLTFAEQHDFPIFEQPYSLPMVKVTELICNRIIQIDLAEHSLRWFLNQVIESPRALSSLFLQRASKLNLTIDTPLMVALILPLDESQIDLSAWTYTLNRLLEPFDCQLPVLEYQDGWYLFVDNKTERDDEQQMQLWRDIKVSLTSQGFPCALGISDTAQGITQLGLAAQQAKQAAQFARNNAGKTMLHYSELGINKIFIAVENQALLADFCRQQLGPLFANETTQAIQIKQTLTAYFENLCSARKTAECLAIHRNTLQHRLQKFEQITQRKLNIAQQRLSIQNALIMESLILDDNNNGK